MGVRLDRPAMKGCHPGKNACSGLALSVQLLSFLGFPYTASFLCIYKHSDGVMYTTQKPCIILLCSNVQKR